MKLRKILVLLMLALAVLSLGACGKKEESKDEAKAKAEGPKVLNVWAFTDELKVVIDDFKAKHPDVNVKFTVIPSEEYPTKLRPVLKTGVGAPDVFLGEMSAVKKWTDTGFWDDLETIAPEMTSKYVSQSPKYVVDMGKNKDGKIVAMSWQATPGGFYYRRSLAKQIFGTDDPAAISDLLSTNEKFIEAAKKVRDASGGKVRMLTGFQDYEWIVRADRKNPWVNGSNELVIDPAMENYFEFSKVLRKENLEAKVAQWTPAWFGSMNKDDIFGYFLPTWGLHYVLKSNAKDTAGDWALAKGPASYYWGGTWMGIYSKSPNKELAKELLNMLCVDDTYMEEYARKTGDFMSNMKVNEKLAGEAGIDFLGGQNHYAFFMEEAKNITPGLETQYDLELNSQFINNIMTYVDGTTSKEESIKKFKEGAKNSFPEITIK